MTFRSWCYRHGIRWHAQNLTRDRGGPERAMWRAGRAYGHISPDHRAIEAV